MIKMPAGGIHLCVAKKLLKNFPNIDEYLFLLGNIAPDSWRNSNSTKIGTHFQINKDGKSNYDYFYQKYKDKLNNPFVLGYFIHLLTDSYWYSNDLETAFANREKPLDYYEEIGIITSKLMMIYNIKPIKKIDEKLENPVMELETSGINKTIEYLNSVNYGKEKETPKYFNLDKTIKGINDTYTYIMNKLEEYPKVIKKGRIK